MRSECEDDFRLLDKSDTKQDSKKFTIVTVHIRIPNNQNSQVKKYDFSIIYNRHFVSKTMNCSQDSV